MAISMQFLMIFYYTELLFPTHSESDRTLISPRTIRAECLEKFFLEILRKNSQEDKGSTPNLSNTSGRKCL